MKWFIVVFLVLALAGCTPQSAPTTPGPVYGDEGVKVVAEDSSYEVYQDEQFSLIFGLFNRGTTAVTRENPGVFSVTYDNLYFDKFTTESRLPSSFFTLDERTPYYEGGEEYVTVNLQARDISRNSEAIRTPVVFNVCYPYKTIQPIQVCIEQTRRVNEGGVVCRSEDLRPRSPGAPVAVTEVKTQIVTVNDDSIGRQLSLPRFRLTIENLDDGISSTTGCGADATFRDLNAVGVSAKLLETPLECSSPTVNFIRGEASVTCDFVRNEDALAFVNQANFISILTVELEYYYRDSDRTEVLIVR